MEGIPTDVLRVLIVEDCPDTATTLKRLVRVWGHAADVARDGAEALGRAAEFRPDVILLDIGLPDMNGWEVAKRLRETPNADHALIIAVTGYGLEDDRRHSEDAGCHLHLTKPVEPGLLQGLLDHLRTRIKSCLPSN